MEIQIKNNKIFSPIENDWLVLTPKEKVRQENIYEIVNRGSRVLLKCHSIIRNIEGLNSEDAFNQICIILLTILRNKKSNGEILSLYQPIVEIKITQSTYNQVLFELEDIDLINIPNGEKGLIFDEFLNTVFRNSLEQTLTPNTIVDYMVDILDPKEGESICDPCCGSGRFLVKSFEHVKRKIEKLGLSENNEIIRLNVSSSNYYGVDINERVVYISKMNLFMHGVVYANVFKQDGFLNNDKIHENQFDIIIAQPPFGLRYDHNSLVPDLFNNNLKEVSILFIERCLNLLKPEGRMGIIVEENILMRPSLEKARNYIESQAKILKITSLPEKTFSSTSIKTSIVFFKKFSKEEKNTYDAILKLAETKVNQKYSILSKDLALKVNSQIQKEIRTEVKSNFDYKILFAEVKSVGIITKGSNLDNNQLPLLREEYKKFLINSKIDSQTILQQAKYSQMVNWSVNYLKNIVLERIEKYAYLKIGSLLIKKTEYIIKEDLVEYQRVTVKFYNKGVVLRDKALGQDIGTKRQIKISKGQLIISKIGASRGAIGIVPNELDKAIVTTDFLTYNINTDRVLPNYLELLLSTDNFMTYFKELQTGSIIERLNESLFLNIEIPLPPLEEQIKLCKKIVQLKANIANLENEFINEKQVFKNALFEI